MSAGKTDKNDVQVISGKNIRKGSQEISLKTRETGKRRIWKEKGPERNKTPRINGKSV